MKLISNWILFLITDAKDRASRESLVTSAQVSCLGDRVSDSQESSELFGSGMVW